MGITKGTARLRRNQMSMTLPFGRNLNASYSPPRRGGVAAPSRKCREATKLAQTWGSVRLAFEGVPNGPPRPRQIGTDPWFVDVAYAPPMRGGECAAPTA